ncbi:LmeA family phospholipid-binding protein [Actinoplanes sp. NPDC026619]|uniref:LmeA family phospholipid-binding protein n=1 Tax=Actinoplanes sp. NPDC026619 TaxID=3155798 RepID=UPI0033D66688
MTMVEPETRTETHRPLHLARGMRYKWVAWLASGLVLVVALAMIAYALPVPFLDSYFRGQIIEQVSSQVSCPGAAAVRTEVTVGGGPLVPQALHKHLNEVTLTVPDATLSGVPHARFVATMRDVTQPAGGTHVGSFDATITVNFGFLPTPKGTPKRTFHKAGDGGLSVDVVMPASSADNVKAKLLMKMRLRGQTAQSVPQRLEIFGKTIPAGQVGDLAGGVRSQQLPALPAGIAYKSITPKPDGVHIEIGGVSVNGLDTLPTDVGGRTVSYSAANGLLGINTTAIGVPLTIHTQPVLGAGALTLVPKVVHIFGGDHQPTDAIGKLVLSQINADDLKQSLPALPSGVTYRSVSVDPEGIKVVVGGVTTQPFSVLKQPPGNPTVFGAEGGLLTATATGGSGEDTPVVLYGKPVIKDSALDISPDQIEMFGVRFPAVNVLAEVAPQETTYALQKLPEGLTYGGVEVLPDGLRIRLTGQDVTMQRGALTGSAC